jgi:hypothetical protein
MWRLALCWLAVGPTIIQAGPLSKEPGRVVVINKEWLAQHGQAPYVLDQPDTRYVLKTDVRTAGTAFVLVASNVVFDLNQHTIVYGDGKPVTVANSGFEEGNGQSVPGWDLSRAPAAELAPNTKVAVGTALSGGPPRRSVRAELPHTALTSGA